LRPPIDDPLIWDRLLFADVWFNGHGLSTLISLSKLQLFLQQDMCIDDYTRIELHPFPQ
jgi:hypothetical protein